MSALVQTEPDVHALFMDYLIRTYRTDSTVAWLITAAIHVVPNLESVFLDKPERVVVEVSPSLDEDGWAKVFVRYKAKTPTPMGFLGKGRFLGGLSIREVPRKKGQVGVELAFRCQGIIHIDETHFPYTERLQQAIIPFK